MNNTTLATVVLSTIGNNVTNVTNGDDPDAYLMQVGRLILSVFQLQIIILNKNDFINGNEK